MIVIPSLILHHQPAFAGFVVPVVVLLGAAERVKKIKPNPL